MVNLSSSEHTSSGDFWLLKGRVLETLQGATGKSILWQNIKKGFKAAGLKARNGQIYLIIYFIVTTTWTTQKWY